MMTLNNPTAAQFSPKSTSARPHFTYKILALGITASLLLTACGDDDDNDSSPLPPAKVGVQNLTTGKLLRPSVNRKNLSASELAATVQTLDPAAASIVGKPVCGVRVEYIHYDTVDAKGAPTDATGAVFIPTGSDPQCTGARPVLLYAHGTTTAQTYNFAEIGNTNNPAGLRAAIIAAHYTGQGYVVIASNYAGYDKSSLNYHPYLNATQQSHDMADALKAGRSTLSQLANTTRVSDNGKLFISGYSQGGFVAMATARYLESLGEPITATVAQSGPYAMGAFGDVVFAGNVMLGGTFFAPLMTNSFQQQFGNLYQNPSEIYTASDAQRIATLLPNRELSERQLVEQGILPQSAMFQASPTGVAALEDISPADAAFGFGFDAKHYLIKNDYRAGYLADAQRNPDWGAAYLKGMTQYTPVIAANPSHPLRQALKANDLRSYTPKSPMVLCGGNQDPMVFFDVNTGLVNQLWSAPTNRHLKYAMVDIDISNQAKRNQPTYYSQGLTSQQADAVQTSSAAMQKAFAQQLGLYATNATTVAKANGASDTQAQQAAQVEVLTRYHTLVAPYCENTARAFFQTF